MSPQLVRAAPWLAGAVLALAALILLRRPVRRLCRVAFRSALWLAALSALGQVGQYVGVTLGVNWVNALVLGVLGAPGLGLLLMLQWAFR